MPTKKDIILDLLIDIVDAYTFNDRELVKRKIQKAIDYLNSSRKYKIAQDVEQD